MILTADDIDTRWDTQLGAYLDEVSPFPLTSYGGSFHTIRSHIAERIAWGAASRVCWHVSATCTYFAQVVHAAFLTHGNQRGIGRYAEGVVRMRDPFSHMLNWFVDDNQLVWFINSPWWNPGRSRQLDVWVYPAPGPGQGRFWGRQC